MIVVVTEQADGSGIDVDAVFVVNTEKLPQREYARQLEGGPGFIQVAYEDSIRFGKHHCIDALVDLPAMVERAHVVWVE
jgi:hypothetical protein